MTFVLQRNSLKLFICEESVRKPLLFAREIKMTIIESIVIGLSSRELAPGIKGTSRAAIRSWLVKNKHAKESPQLNAAIRRALKKAMEEGLVIPDGPQRFRLDLKKRDAMRRAANKKKSAAAKKKRASASKKRKSSTTKRKSSTKKRKTASKSSKRKSASKKRSTKSKTKSKSKSKPRSKSKKSSKK